LYGACISTKSGGIGGDAMIVTEGSERFGNVSRLARQNAHHIRFIMDTLFISMHKGDVNRSFQRIYLIGNASLSCLHMLASDASILDGPRALHSGTPSIIVDGHPSQMELKTGPAYQECCKPSQDAVWLSAHLFKTSGVDWDPKLFDIDLQHVDDIQDRVRGVVDLENPFCTYGEYCCSIFSTFDQYGEHKHQVTRMPCNSSTVIPRSNL
jgi:hypothetical protein